MIATTSGFAGVGWLGSEVTWSVCPEAPLAMCVQTRRILGVPASGPRRPGSADRQRFGLQFGLWLRLRFELGVRLRASESDA